MSKYHQRRGFSFSSCFATLIGVILLPIAILGLYYIEEFALSEYLTKEFAKKNYIETSADTIEADKEGKLVLIHGKAATADILNDDIFNTKVDNSLSLNRKVEMYQWEETKHKHSHTTGSGKHKRTHTTTTYSYDKKWCEYVINSDHFHYKSDHDNPNVMYHQSSTFFPKNVTVGAFKVNSSDFKELGPAESLNIDETTAKLPDSAIILNNKIYYNIYLEATCRGLKSQKEQEIKNENASNTANPESNTLLEGSFDNDTSNTIAKEKSKYNEKSPNIGDVRISFTKHPVCEVTILAKQSGDELVPYKTEYNNIYEVAYGDVSFDEIFKEKEKGMTIIVWVARIFAFLALGFAFLMISFSIEKIGCVIGLSLPLAITTGIIGFVWLPHKRVLAAISLVLMAIGLIIAIGAIFKINSENNNRSSY